jgi:hypothetical protein
MELDAFGPPGADMFSQYLALGRVALVTGITVWAGAQAAVDPGRAVSEVKKVLQGAWDSVCDVYHGAEDLVRKINTNANDVTRDAYV